MQKLIAGPIDGYKIVNNDLTCTPDRTTYQYEIGKIHILKNDDPLVLCKNGFHFCKYPSGVWSYYSTGRLFKIKAWDILDIPAEPGADYKLVCKKIQLIEEVPITGDRNTGYNNTGDNNTGDRNTGYGNTGDNNTGYGNAGNGNCCNYHTGFFSMEEPPIILFDKPCDIKRKNLPRNLINNLAYKLSLDEDFNPNEFLDIPNSSIEGIKRLHEAHKAKRKELIK